MIIIMIIIVIIIIMLTIIIMIIIIMMIKNDDVKKVARSKLNGGNFIEAINTWAVSRHLLDMQEEYLNGGNKNSGT